MRNKFYVYIIQSKKKDLFYIGYTENLTQRLKAHNRGISTFTRLKGPWDLIWYCVFPYRDQALEFERYLKSHTGRIFIYKRIINPAEHSGDGRPD
ncbi:MAG: GIY-YIG nuclease family protein [Candidatus Omnitrophica bacterium]|nr:GIY-YIG nuclease family protein [Candidatus Omnitrophota bacterium]